MMSQQLLQHYYQSESHQGMLVNISVILIMVPRKTSRTSARGSKSIGSGNNPNTGSTTVRQQQVFEWSDSSVASEKWSPKILFEDVEWGAPAAQTLLQQSIPSLAQRINEWKRPTDYIPLLATQYQQNNSNSNSNPSASEISRQLEKLILIKDPATEHDYSTVVRALFAASTTTTTTGRIANNFHNNEDEWNKTLISGIFVIT